MFLVGGGILVHGIGPLHHWIDAVTGGVASHSASGAILRLGISLLFDAAVGIVVGASVLAVVRGVLQLRHRHHR